MAACEVYERGKLISCVYGRRGGDEWWSLWNMWGKHKVLILLKSIGTYIKSHSFFA